MSVPPAPPKPALQSKTIWLALLTFATGGLGALQNQHVLDPNVALMVSGALAILLRYVTSQPIK